MVRYLCLVAALAVACDSTGSRSSADPAHAGRVDLGWEVSEVIRIGVAEGQQEYMFNRIADIAADADGRLFVLDQGNRVVRSYDVDGNHLGTFGAHGGGPGEFELPLGLVVSSDSVVVFDALQQRLTIFDRSGRILGTTPVELSPFLHGMTQGMGRAGTGWALVLATGCRMPRPEDPRPRWKLALVDEAGGAQVVFDVPAENELAVYAERACTSLPALARPTPSVAFDPEGLLYLGDGESYQIEVFDVRSLSGDPDSPPIRLVGRGAPPREVMPEGVSAYEREWLESDRIQSDASFGDVVQAAWDSIGHPTHWPYFEELHVDRRRHLWVGRPRVGDEGHRDWDVFDPQGTYLGTLELPADLEIMEIAGPMIWGLTRDEFDVEYVVGLEVDPLSN